MNEEFVEVPTVVTNERAKNVFKWHTDEIANLQFVVDSGDIWVDVEKQVVMVDITTGKCDSKYMQNAGVLMGKLVNLPVEFC